MVSVSVLGWHNFKIRVLTNSFDSDDDPTLLTLRICCKGNSNATGPPHSFFTAHWANSDKIPFLSKYLWQVLDSIIRVCKR